VRGVHVTSDSMLHSCFLLPHRHVGDICLIHFGVMWCRGGVDPATAGSQAHGLVAVLTELPCLPVYLHLYTCIPFIACDICGTVLHFMKYNSTTKCFTEREESLIVDRCGL
jgi:hypothetical protein